MADAGELKARATLDNAEFMSALKDLGDKIAAQTEAASKAFESMHAAVESSAGGIKEMAEQLTLLGESLAITEKLKEFGTEALNAYAATEKAAVSLTALTGNAEAAEQSIEGLKELALSDALSFPSLLAANQKMTALGFSTEQIQKSLHAAADAGGALGKDFTEVASTMDRLVLTGNASGKALAGLGLTAADLGRAMGVTADQAKEAFKSLDQGGRIEALSTALEKFGGVAEKQAQTLAGEWTNFKTQFELMAEDVGKELAPLAKQFLEFTKTEIVPFLKSLIEQFSQLPEPVKEAAIALGMAAAAIPPLTAGFSAILLGVNALRGVIPALTGMFEALGVAELGAVTALGPLAPLIVAVGAAAVVTAAQIANFTQKMKEVEGQAIRQAIASGKSLEELEKMGISAAAIKEALGGMNQQLDKSAATFETTGLGLKVVHGEIVNTSKAAVDLADKVRVTVSTISQLKELGKIGETADPFKQLDDSAQKAFDTFLRGFQGMDEAWNEAAAGLNIDKLAGDLQKLKAQFEQEGAAGVTQYGLVRDAAGKLQMTMQKNAGASLGYLQVVDALRLVQKYMSENLPAAADKLTDDIDKHSDRIIADFQNIADRINATTQPLGAVAAEMSHITAEIAKTQTNYETLSDAVAQLASLGILTGDTLADYLLKVEKAARDANVPLSDMVDTLVAQAVAAGADADAIAQLLGQLAQLNTKFETIKTKGRDVFQEVSQAIERDLSRALSDVIFQTGKIADAFKRMGQDVVDIILNHIIKMALDPLLNKLDAVLGKIFSMSSGGGGGAAGAGGGGGIGGGIGGAVMGGAMGWASLGLSAVTAVSSVISNFQMARQENTLNAIELNTRQSAMWIGGLGGGGLQDWAHIVAVNTTPLKSIDTWIHDSWVELLDNTSYLKKGGAGAAGGGGGVVINVNGAGDPQTIANLVASYLKTLSPKFSP